MRRGAEDPARGGQVMRAPGSQRSPRRQASLDLQLRHTRSPAHSLAKRWPHIRHLRSLRSPSILGFDLYGFAMADSGKNLAVFIALGC